MQVLSRASLAYLATVEEDGGPHLSLMQFSLVETDGDIALVMVRAQMGMRSRPRMNRLMNRRVIA